MFLKLSFIDESKKLVFKEDYKQPANVRALVTKLKGYKDNEFSLIFIDMENEQITLRDEFDMAYFLSQKEDGRKYLELMVVKQDLPVEHKEENKITPVGEFTIIQKNEEAKETQEQLNNDYGVELKSEVIQEKKDIPVEEESIEKEDETEENLEDLNVEKIDKENKETIEENIPEELKEGEIVVDLEIEKEEKIEEQPVITEKKEEEIKENNKEEEKREELPFEKFLGNIIGNISQILQDKNVQNKLNKFQKCISNKIKQHKEAQEAGVHYDISCNGCKVFPIIGKRFHCMTCNDYDLCFDCEKKDVHNHPMMRLRSPVNWFQLNKLKNKTNKSAPVQHHPFSFFGFPCRNMKFRRGCEEKKQCRKMKWARKNRRENSVEAKRQVLDFMFRDSISQQKKEAMIEKYATFPMPKFVKKVHKEMRE